MAEVQTEERNSRVGTDGQKTNGKAVERTETVERKGPVKRLLPFIFLAILIAAGIYGWHMIQYNKVHENTDDAQIDADISPILPRVSGYVQGVYVSDNDNVDSNTVLVTIDPRDLLLKVSSAQAALVTAQAAVRTAEASATAASSNIAAAEVNRSKTAQDLVRARGVLAGGAMTQEQFDAVEAAAKSAEDQLKSVQDQAAAAQTQIASADAQVKAKQVDLDNAKLQLTYATISSPTAGTIAKKSVELGEFVQAGQPLMAVTQRDIWITANFKETQVGDIHAGQQVEFSVDAYPDEVFLGTVQSVSPATGAKFSLLPPDNASGNFVKVTQRVPVKILVNRGDYTKTPLRPGMSVDATISTAK